MISVVLSELGYHLRICTWEKFGIFYDITGYILIRHKVKDYTKWKPVFDEHGATRKASGSKGGYLFRNTDDLNEVVMCLELDDLEKTRQFVESEDLRQAMERSGVVDQPDVYFLDLVDRSAA